MKFLHDLVMTGLGLCLIASIVWNGLTLYAYLIGDDISGFTTSLWISVPAMVVLFILAWRKREVWWAAISWIFPG